MTTTHRSRLILPLAAALMLWLSTVPSWAAEPMTPLMQTLREIFPRGHGLFLEGPLGAPDGVPEKAIGFFTQPRVLVPNVDAVQPALGRLFAASSTFPLRKITRYDEKPGVQGLPGVRLVWCATENEDDVGFAIVTPEQNRFLIWARDNYFRACQIDSLEPKVRDWYARSLSEYLASVAFGVPGTYPPKAEERQLPLWMDAYPPAPPRIIADDARMAEFIALQADINLWDCTGLLAFVPTDDMLEHFMNSVTDTLYLNEEPFLLQQQLRDIEKQGGQGKLVTELTRAMFDSLAPGQYRFAVDRYGRVRVCAADSSAASIYTQTHAFLFAGDPVLAAGWMDIRRIGDANTVHAVNAYSRTYYYSPYEPNIRTDLTDHSDGNLVSLGHLFASLQRLDIPYAGVLIRKF